MTNRTTPILETETMQEETRLLEAQNTSLQLLVSELLLTDRQVRLEIAQLKRKTLVAEVAVSPAREASLRG